MDIENRLPSDAPEVVQPGDYPEVDMRQPVYVGKGPHGNGDVTTGQNAHHASEGVARSPSQYPENGMEKIERRRRICGLSARAFWVLVALLTVLVIGAAVGGGVRATVGKNKSKSFAARYAF
jgi:hypothetical protein